MYDNSNYHLRKKCASCKRRNLAKILDFGNTPLAGDFLTPEQVGHETLYPLGFSFCSQCGLFQTDSTINPDVLFQDYRYLSSVGLSKHFTEMADYLIEEFSLNASSKVLDIGSNDGVLLKPLMDRGINATGIDPAKNVSKIARDKGCNVFIDYFNESAVRKYFKKTKFDVITCNNCFAHIDDINSIVKSVKRILSPKGAFVIEVHYIKNLIQQLQWDNCYAEHQFYYSLSSLSYLFGLHGMVISDFEEVPVHAGSIRVVVRHAPHYVKNKVIDQRIIEELSGLTSKAGLMEFADSVKNTSREIHDTIVDLKAQGKKIIGYGASGRATILSHFSKLNSDLIDYIVDESPERFGRFLPSTHIPIYNKDFLDNDVKKPDYIVIFAWNFSKMIIDKLNGLGYKFIIPLPKIQIISSPEELNLRTL